MSENKSHAEPTGLEIAVIGMSGRFPGAADTERFWENLKNGVESITFFTREELETEGISEDLLDNPNYIPARGILTDVEYFDSSFFGYTAVESELMDPQIRVFYECAWWALENAGYSPDTYEKNIGMFAGATNNRHWEGLAILSGKTATLGAFGSDHLIDRDFLSTRIAYRLNLRGPAITLKTACSTSLVAVDLACRMLLTGQCDIALAGGVSIPIPFKTGYLYQEGMINSPDGHCRAFDAESKGVIFSNGVGIAVLKRLEEAIADGDNIWAVIKGSATNNDGSRKGSYSAPGVEGQADVIRAAHQIAEVEPETIDYVETHGTGTMLGDPVEIEGLKLAFDTDKRRYCAIGSVKTNIGHLDTAAGIASFLKTVLALHHKYIPPSLHFEKPNPKIDFENSPFYVNTKLREWKRGDHPRRAGVSSFGVGGTNAHVILEEAPEREPSSKNRNYQLILLSAKTEKALDQMSKNFREYLSHNPGINLADAAYTLQVGRSAFKHRQMSIASTTEDVISCLTPQDDAASFDAEKVMRGAAKDQIRPIFMFSGQGSQYVDMGLEIYNEEPDFAQEMDRCFAIFTNVTGYNIKDILYPSTLDGPGQEEEKERINRTEMTQPVIFIFEYALARLLMKWGIVPYAMIGHSIGEYVAACLSGVFSLEDAIKVVAIRGKLMQKMPPGSMLSVPLPEAEVIPLLGDDLELAAVNAPALCVVSGPGAAIKRLEGELNAKGIQVRSLHTSHAFHSRMMEPILGEFEKEVAAITLNKPQIPYISNLTGAWIKIEEATTPSYWARHLRKAVRFADGLSELLQEENALLIEVGPGLALSTFARQHTGRKPGQSIVNLVRRPKENIPDAYYLLSKIGRLWLSGQHIDWKTFYSHERRRRAPLPLYPFQRQRFWISREAYDNLGSHKLDVNASLAKKKKFDEWFYIPSWKRTIIPGSGTGKNQEPMNWLLFIDECGLGAQLAGELRKAGHHVVAVTAGPGFSRKQDDRYEIDLRAETDYDILIDALEKDGKSPHRIVHLWNVTRSDVRQWGPEWNEMYLDKGFYSLLYLARAIGKQNISAEVRLMVLTNRAQSALGNEELSPEKAVIMGPVNVIPQEFPNMLCRSVDIVLPRSGSPEEQKLVQCLMREMLSASEDKIVAYRDNFRLVQAYEPAVLPDPGEIVPLLKEGGVYIITGGLGGIGLALARFLAEHCHARLILTGRSVLPGREEWDNWLISRPVYDPTSQKIRGVKSLEALGAQVGIFSVDVIDYKGMAEMLEQAQVQFGPINGVIHAAGLPGGGIIQLKTREMAERVLLPKVRGTLVLESLLKKNPLDFILLCSSISSVVSDLGQVDYFAANAFLDAYAYYKTAVDDVFTVSVNWDAWQEVGMAVEAAKETSIAPAAPVTVEAKPLEISHPMFEQYIPGVEESRKYVTHLSLEKSWPLRDHMTAEGKGLLPGTAYLEMARAAWESYAGGGPVEIRDVNFVAPMMVNEGEVREVYLTLEKQAGENSAIFTVESIVPTEVNFIQKHATGKIGPLKEEEALGLDLEEIKARCNIQEFIAAENEYLKPRDEKYRGLLVFGPHWHTTRWKKFGKNEGLNMLQLPAVYMEELNRYKLHPSLLDSATGFMFGHIYKGSAYIPFSYKRLRMYRPFPDKILSYSRLIEDNDTMKEFLKFNVVVMDEQGNICVAIEEFTMLEVLEDMKTRIKAKEQGWSSPAPGSPAFARGLNARQKHLIGFGIRPSEGVRAFTRILGSRIPQVVVSTVDLPQRIELRKKSAEKKYKDAQLESESTTRLLRPDIGATYAAPRTDTEKQVAEIWQNHLGIDSIGIDDDFFELGGDSLKATVVIAKIHKMTNVKVSLAEMFKGPTIRELAKIIKKSDKEKYAGIREAEKREYYLLSSAQKRLYVLQQMNPESTAYNMLEIIPLRAGSDWEKIEEVFKQLVKRHESLRTSFHLVDESLVQKIHEHVSFEIEQLGTGDQWSGVREETSLSKVIDPPFFQKGRSPKAIIKSFIRPFRLSQAPLMRVGILKDNDGSYILVVDMHHIISDGVSHDILSKDFHALYNEEKISPLLLQYKDFSEWQNSENEREHLKRQEEFWIKEFAGEIPVLELPTDYPRPQMQSYEGDNIYFEIPAQEIRALNAVAQQEGATLFMVLTAAFNIFLSKLSGQEEIIVGAPIAGRRHVDLEKIIGMFVNTLALRNYPSGYPTFREFLVDVKERLLMVFENQEYPFEELVDKLSLPRDIGRNPLFDVMFVLYNMNMELTGQDKETDIETARPVQPDSTNKYEDIIQTAQFDLTLTAMEKNHGLFFFFEYCTKLFKKETITRFIIYFKKILAIITKEPNIKIGDIEIISDGEKKQILDEFNKTEAVYPKDKTINQLFEEQAEKTADRIAVVGGLALSVPSVRPGGSVGPVSLSYRELNEQSTRLARRLIGKGVLADTIVGIMMERSVEMLMGIMGILKAGGAYMPIDPEYPQERIDYMLKDSGAKLLVSANNKEGEKVRRWEGERVLFEEIFNPPGSSSYPLTFLPSYPLGSSNLAYIIYTSGTTGNPKGVMIEHRGMVNHIYAKINDLQLDDLSVVAQNASQMFDISVWQFLTALIIGGRTVIIPNEIILEPINFMTQILGHKITILEVVPSYLTALLDIPPGEYSYSSLYLQYLLVTGEAVNQDLLKRWFLKYPGIKVVNAYGPTEASDDITHYVMAEAPGIVQVPIGSPVQNMNIYILDKYMNMCPIGVKGELMAAGVGVGRGYLNRPQLTADKFTFFPNFLTSSLPNFLLYRTGDLARWLDDGNIEFLGRIDQQVKIRGFRIELEEIENELSKHADIKETVVAARKDKDGSNILCCYFVSGKEFTVSQLRGYLSERLPDYMLPAYFIPLVKIPLTPNGKIDRKNLPEPTSMALGGDAVYRQPRNTIEKIMAAIWQDALGINTVSIDDNYFAIGGDSINSIQIISRLKKAGYVLEMKDIFRHPRISELGTLVKKIEPIRDQAIITSDSYNNEKELTPGDLTYPGLSLEMFAQLQEKYSYLIEDIYPLSPMQEIMLFYTLYEGKNRPLYFLQESSRVNLELNPSLFERSFNELIKRHGILRSAFIYEGLDRPLQVVLKERNVDFYFEDLRESMPTLENKETYIRRFIEKDRQRAFDLSDDVLLRLTIFQLADTEYQVTWSSHHILMDGWSTEILKAEFSKIYAAVIGNTDIQLPAVNPYRTYIQWLENREKNQTQNYWQNYLEGYDESAALPRKKSKEKFQGVFKPASASALFGEEKTIALKKVAIRNDVTLNTLIQAVWAIVLGKYSSKQDVVFGMLVSGRPSEIEGVDAMIGCFINTVPIRIFFNNEQRFNELLHIVQDRAVESEKHHYFSLAEIQAQSTLKQNLLDHIIQFQNFPIGQNTENRGSNEISGNSEIETKELSEMNAFEQGGDYNFYVTITPLDEISFSFYYNAHFHDRELVEQLGFNCIRVLEQIIEHEKIVIADIAILSEDEKRKLLFEFNDHRADFPREKTIYRMIEGHADTAPDRIAVNHHSDALFSAAASYSRLNRGANRLAKILRYNGIQKDEPVGILMERSEQMVESILAVWKAGGAYIPLDTDYPPGRITDILHDSAAKVLITRDIYIDSQLEEEYGGEIVRLANPTPGMSPEEANSDLAPQMSSLAYIIYTSGSTGKPKGVMIEHTGMMNHIQAKINDLRLTAKSIVAQNASHTFDISVWQFFVALTLGGVTVIYPNKLILDPGEFLSRVMRDQIAVLEVVPSYLSVLLDYIRESNVLPLALQYLLLTGEELKPFLVKNWFETYPGIKMVNAYGPTEASDDITHHIMDKAPGMERIPIGKPLQNMNIYIVDNNMQLCPIGVKGEICVSGVGVGRGYLGDEEKTKQVFMEDPFVSPLATHHSPFTNNRLYKTGDLGSWLPDGTIEFFGRKDHQVKIRGFRIELEEIENKLLSHPQIKEVVVADKEDKTGNKYLCAYIVAHSDNLPGFAGLKEYLAGSLPDYMIPAYFVQMEKIPLTTNGKIDRKALPIPDLKAGEGYAAPRTAIEKKMIGLWSEILGRDALHVSQLQTSLGIDDNFFQLGGHSLKATVLASRIHKELNVVLPLAELFKNPTIRGLSAYIAGTAEDIYQSVIPVEEREYYVLSFAQKRMYILQQLESNSTAYNMPQIIPLTGEVDTQRLEESFRKLIKRHDSLRTSFHMIEDQPAQRIHHHVEFKIEYYNLSTDYRDDKDNKIHHFIRVFNLSEAPLLRVGFVKTAEGKQYLLADMHHIISDGISHQVLREDFRALHEGKELPPLPLQYKDFSQWQNHEKQKQRLKDQEDFWLQEFAGELPVLDLPTDYPRPLIQSFEGNSVAFEIPARETRALNAVALREGATLFMVLAAVFNILLSKLSGREEIVIGFPIAGRRHADLEKIIGMFVNTLSLKNYPSGSRTLKEFLADVKERLLMVFENQDYPFEALVEKLAVRRDTGRNPIFDIMLVLENMNTGLADRDKELEIETRRPVQPASTGEDENIFQATAKFDLTLTAIEINHGLFLTFQYCTKLFKKETIERFIIHFKKIAEIMVKDPGIMLGQMEIISEEEKKRILDDFNKIGAVYGVAEKIPLSSEYTPPANEIEEKLTQIWAAVLEIEQEKISARQNFFEIGGTSLSLIRQLSRIYKEFGIEVSANQIYHNPTIQAIAKSIQTNKYADEPVVLLNQPVQKKFFCFPPSVGFGIAYQALANIINDYALYSFNFIEDENRLNEYVEIITKLQPMGSYTLFGWSAAGKLIFEVVRALEDRGFEVSDIILADCFRDEDEIKGARDGVREGQGDVNHFVINLERQMEDYGIGYLKEKVRKKATMYSEYLGNLNKLEVIHSNIHLIVSEESQDEVSIEPGCWNELTAKEVAIYKGFGSHDLMFSGDPLEKNAGLIREILDRIESERQISKC